jgi:hypothetical protein
MAASLSARFQAFSNSENIIGSDDSGGAVFDSVSPEGFIDAVGVISGKVGTPTTKCKGIAGGRKCAKGNVLRGD